MFETNCENQRACCSEIISTFRSLFLIWTWLLAGIRDASSGKVWDVSKQDRTAVS